MTLLRTKDDTLQLSLADYPDMTPMGNFVRVISCNGRKQLVIQRKLAERVAKCGEPPAMAPSPQEIRGWIGLAFLFGSVFGASLALVLV